jgi:anti-sigma factor RsiW
MATHEEFLELCAAAVAGELTADEQSRLDAHLVSCPECRQATSEYEIAWRRAISGLAFEVGPAETEPVSSWSVEEAEKSLFKRLRAGEESSIATEENKPARLGHRFTYRRSPVKWEEAWMSLAAVALLSLALALTANRTGVKPGFEVTRTIPQLAKETDNSLEAQASDAGCGRAQLQDKLAEEDKLVADLRRQLSKERKTVSVLKAVNGAVERPPTMRQPEQASSDATKQRDTELAAPQAKLLELRNTIDSLTGAAG